MPLPQARPGLLRHRLDDQVLVYEPSNDTVHLLEPGTGCVLELLQEGGWTGEGIIAELERRLNLAVDESYVVAATGDLRTAGLLETETTEQPIDFGRREFVRKSVVAGASAMLGAAIVSLTPTTGDAQTNLCAGQPNPGLPPGSPCSSDSQCCGPATRKCVEYGGSSAKRCCFYDKGTGKKCNGDPPNGVCCASAPPTFACTGTGNCP
jgi:hypothetical protein